MNWREKIIAAWPDNLQKAHRARVALTDLDRILGELAAMGHPLHVEEGYVPPPPPGWPKAVFHVHAGARIVRDQFELDELGEDWHPTMEEARQAEGMRKQFERGGVFNPRSMPTLLTQTPQEIMRRETEAVRMREQQKKFVDDMRMQHRSGFAEQVILIDHAGEEHEPDIAESFERLRVRQ